MGPAAVSNIKPPPFPELSRTRLHSMPYRVGSSAIKCLLFASMLASSLPSSPPWSRALIIFQKFIDVQANLLNQQQFSDVTFEIEGRNIYAHKCMPLLTAMGLPLCPVVRAILCPNPAVGSDAAQSHARTCFEGCAGFSSPLLPWDRAQGLTPIVVSTPPSGS